jgi:hypothetical protein
MMANKQSVMGQLLVKNPQLRHDLTAAERIDSFVLVKRSATNLPPLKNTTRS